MNSVTSIIEDGGEAISQALKWDMEIAEDDLRYSTWFSGLSSAGIAIVFLNYKNFKGSTSLDLITLDVLVTISITLFVAGLVTGAFTKRHISAFLKKSRTILTAIMGQKLHLKYNEDLVEEFESKTALEIMGGMNSGEYMPDAARPEWKRLQENKDRHNRYYNLGYRIQEILVILGYVMLVLLGAPLARILVTI